MEILEKLKLDKKTTNGGKNKVIREKIMEELNGGTKRTQELSKNKNGEERQRDRSGRRGGRGSWEMEGEINERCFERE